MSVRRIFNEDTEKGSIKALMRAVQDRIDELEEESMDESLCESDEEVWEEFDALTFNPNSSWNEIYKAVIEPIIDDHYNNIGPGYTQDDAEEDIMAIVGHFEDEYGFYPNVKKACGRFWANPGM